MLRAHGANTAGTLVRNTQANSDQTQPYTELTCTMGRINLLDRTP